jgi:hypothetical protein
LPPAQRDDNPVRKGSMAGHKLGLRQKPNNAMKALQYGGKLRG